MGVLNTPTVVSLLGFKSLLLVGSGLLLEMLEQFARDPFNLNAKQLGILKALQLGAMAVSHGLLVDLVQRRFLDGVLITCISFTCLSIALLGLTSQSFAALAVCSMFATLGI